MAALGTPLVWPAPVEPASAKVHTRAELVTAFKASPLSHLALMTTVDQYRSMSAADWEAAMAWANEAQLQYKLPWFSCVEFACLMKGLLCALTGVNGVGWVLGFDVHHSFNALLVSDDSGGLSIEIAEPQTDLFVDLGTDPHAVDYKTVKGRLIF